MIFFDNNATTPLCSKAKETMKEEMELGPSNPSSPHAYGREAKKRLYHARATIAQFLSVDPSNILFTSGGTESMNLLIRGLTKPGRILTTNAEHAAVYNTIHSVSDKIDLLPPVPTAQEVQEAICDDTSTLILTAVNSETGDWIDLEAIGRVAQENQLVFIVDGVALLGKEPFRIPPGVSGIGFSAHKFHGPKGVGFCYIDQFSHLHPSLTGGPQEINRRAGTENLVGIRGMAAAIESLHPIADLSELRDTFERKLLEALPQAKVNHKGRRVGNVSNIYFEGIDGETLLILLDSKGVLVSQGSACSSGALEPSRILLAMGYSMERAKQSIRFSFSRYNTLDEIDEAIAIIAQEVAGVASYA